MTKELKNLSWIEELLPNEFIAQRMHDGVGYYLNEKLILILIESSFTSLYRGVTYPFQIWNGCFFPIVKLKQNTVIKNFLFLENHPALSNCLYLPLEDENFEERALAVIKEIIRGNPLFGEFIQIKKPARYKSAESPTPKQKNRPTLFSDEPPPEKPRKVIEKTKKSMTKKSRANKKPENAFLLSKIK